MTEDSAVAIARLEALLTGVKTQIDQQDRNQQQLVRLFDERVSARFDSVDKRLDAMDKAREESRAETTKLREVTEERLKELEGKALATIEIRTAALHDRDEALETRIHTLENFNARLVGVAIAVSALTGVVTYVIDKAVGG